MSLPTLSVEQGRGCDGTERAKGKPWWTDL